MTVKELRKALEAYPEDAQVFSYTEHGEEDGLIDKITIDHPLPPDPEEVEMGEYEPDDFFTPHYCQGDSEAQRYWEAFGPNVPIVFLHTSNIYYDFEDMKRRKENA